MAVSAFAPGAQVVRDGYLHTAVGFADYVIKGRTATATDPLGAAVPIGTCADCKATVAKPAVEVCPVCGAVLRTFDLYQPRGFRTSYQPKDYDDETDNTSHPALPALALVNPPKNRIEVGALTLETYEQAQVIQANDNRGDLFPFRRLSDASVVAADESLFPPRTWKTANGVDIGSGAIGELRTTDALVIGLDKPDVPGGAVVSSRALLPAGPAAFWSFAEVLRRACQVALDIDPQELVIGLLAIHAESAPSFRIFPAAFPACSRRSRGIMTEPAVDLLPAPRPRLSRARHPDRTRTLAHRTRRRQP